MTIRKNQAGFAALELLLIVIVLAVFGYVAVTAYNGRQTATAPAAEQTTKVSDVPSAPSINSTSDLTTAEQTLDNTNLDASTTDASQLDTQTSTF